MIPNVGRGLPRRARHPAGLAPDAGVVTARDLHCVAAIVVTDRLPVPPTADRTPVRPIGRRLSVSPSFLYLAALCQIPILTTRFSLPVEPRAVAPETPRVFRHVFRYGGLILAIKLTPTGGEWGGCFLCLQEADPRLGVPGRPCSRTLFPPCVPY